MCPQWSRIERLLLPAETRSYGRKLQFPACQVPAGVIFPALTEREECRELCARCFQRRALRAPGREAPPQGGLWAGKWEGLSKRWHLAPYWEGGAGLPEKCISLPVA